MNTTPPKRVSDIVVPQQNVVDLRPGKKPAGGKRRRRWLWIVLTLLIIAAIAAGLILLRGNDKTKTAKPNPHITQSANNNQVVDDPLGIKFSISKDFTVIDSPELKKMSPFFIYGFKQADVPNVTCIVSQTNRAKAGPVTGQELRDGTLNQLKTSFPDVQLLASAPIALKNRHDAVSMDVSYHDKGAAIRQAEVVATTDKRTTFAYCASPDSLFNHYKTKFNGFFSSLEIY